MTQLTEIYPELYAEDGDPVVERVVADLERVYTSAMPADRRATIAHTLRTLEEPSHSAAMPLFGVSRRMPRWSAVRMRRLAAPVAALLLAVGGLMSYLQAQSPTTVSAQTILRRAAQASAVTSAYQDIHQVSRVALRPAYGQGVSDNVQIEGPLTLTVDQWIQVGAAGTISRLATTATDPTGAVVFRILREGHEVRTYGAKERTIDVMTAPNTVPSLWISDPANLTSAGQLLRDAQTHAAPYMHVLPQQTLDSTRVDVVQVTADHHQTTYYIDVQSYRVRGVDQSGISPGGQVLPEVTVRVLQRASVRLIAVPASTFTLHAPAGAHVHDLRTAAHAIDVGQAVRQHSIPAPLLSRDVSGLRLQAVGLARRQGAITTSYQYVAHMNDPARFKVL